MSPSGAEQQRLPASTLKRADRFSSKGAYKWTRGMTSKPDKSEHACVWLPRTCSCSEAGLRVEATRQEKAGNRAHRLKNRPPPNQTKTRFPSELEHKLLLNFLAVLVASTDRI